MNKKLFISLSFCLIFFNILDFVLTYIGISNYDFSIESNENIVFMVKTFGWTITGIIKILGVPILLLLVNKSLQNLQNNKYYKCYYYFVCSVLLILSCIIIIVDVIWIISLW